MKMTKLTDEELWININKVFIIFIIVFEYTGLLEDLERE